METERLLKYGYNPNQKPARVYMNDGSAVSKIVNRYGKKPE